METTLEQPITSLSQLDIANGIYSYADYLTWQFEQTVELIRGHIWPMSAPSRKHQRISWKLAAGIEHHFAKQTCQPYAAPFDVRLYDRRKSAKANKDVYTVIQPDLCIVCDLDKLDDQGCLGAPDLVIEILSPGNSAKEMKIKKLLYEENAVREYWIVDPDHETVFQFHLTDTELYSPATIYASDDLLQSVVFPDFTVELTPIFANN
jgi:Uma2 family endonuclease